MIDSDLEEQPELLGKFGEKMVVQAIPMWCTGTMKKEKEVYSSGLVGGCST
jgi:hypothetical protein